MRNKDGFLELEDVIKFCSYLYADNEVMFSNGMVDIIVRMDEDFEIWYRQLGDNRSKEYQNDQQSTITGLLGIIEQIKEEPKDVSWEDIKWQVSIMITLNEIKI